MLSLGAQRFRKKKNTSIAHSSGTSEGFLGSAENPNLPIMATREKKASWVVDVANSIREADPSAELERWRKRSIYRIPSWIKDLNVNAYKPKVVSLGPYNHGDPDLLPMEEHKCRAVFNFLKRVGRSFDDLISGMEEIVQQLYESYQNLGEEWKDKHRFLELMIVDGCFVLEIINIAFADPANAFDSPVLEDCTHDDHIFGSCGLLVPYIKRDMLMLENQIPLLVLEKLWDIASTRSENKDTINLMVLYFCATNGLLPEYGKWPRLGRRLHPLDLFHKSLLHGSELVPPPPRWVASKNILSAVELYEAGIQLKKSDTNSILDVRFDKGVLSLPEIVVNDATECIFLNLMAFERLHSGAGNAVTSYILFMDNIIDSAKDVSLLQSKGIIQIAVGNNESVAKLFNNLSRDLVLDLESRLDHVHRELNDYVRSSYRKSWNMWRANLIHTYFNSPWTIISLLAATFLLGLTVTQTVYTILPYYQ